MRNRHGVASLDATPGHRHARDRRRTAEDDLYLGIDCGGTSTKLLLARAAAGASWTKVRTSLHPTPSGPDPVGGLRALAEDFLGGQRCTGIGLSVPGIVDDHGRVSASTNLPWLVGASPADLLCGGVPGALVNDGVAAAKAEATMGAGRGYDDLFVYVLGTGIAGAHVLAGDVRRGAHGCAYEVGHIGTGVGRMCSCGQRGCLETVIGGYALGAAWDELRGAPASSRALDVTVAARAGDPCALEVLDVATTALARSMLGVITMLDPQAIAVGGGLARSADLLLAPAVAKLRGYATFQTVPPVVACELGVWAGAWGAALAARRPATIL